MSKAIANKDQLLLRRESLVKPLLIATVVLLAASVLAGLQRENVFDKERAAASIADKEVWMNQGDRNPHSAAHFSRYAFRPAASLSLIDPGTNDFAGQAVWMEAHYQDPAVFRRAEDASELGRFTLLTPAFLLLVGGPLLIFLTMHGAIAGEREDGTMRQLLATGVGAGQFFQGKLRSGLGMTMRVYTPAFFVLALFSLFATPGGVTADGAIRAGAMYLTFAIYLAICVAIAIAVSAMYRTRQAAFLALAATWVVIAVMAPRLASDVATAVAPQPDARVVSNDLRAASDIWYADKDRQERIQQSVLDEYGAVDIDSLPINYGAYALQVSEELSNPEFDRVYGGLDSTYRLQESVVRLFSVLSPTIPAAGLSRAFAGTDREHQRDFTVAAELHRRDMIKMLNEDYMLNGQAGPVYTANAELWALFEDFAFEPRAIAAVAGRYLGDFVALLLWAAAALFVAQVLVGRAVRSEVPTA